MGFQDAGGGGVSVEDSLVTELPPFILVGSSAHRLGARAGRQ